MKKKSKVAVLLIVGFLSYWFYLSFEEFTPPSREEIDERINYLERVISEPLTKDSEVAKLRYESSEFMLFSYAYSTYAFTNLIVSDSTYKERLVPLIKESIRKTLHKAVYYQYNIEEELLFSDSIPDYSVLYLGHLNLMLGCYRLVSDDSCFNELNDKISGSLYNRYNKKSFLCLESYSNAIWIPDNTVALASLRLHSVNSGSVYGQLCEKWIEYAKENFIDSDTEVLCSTVNTDTGQAEEEPRGSMLGWSIMFIYQFDSDYAIDLYNNYKEHFSDNLLALRLFRERADKRFLSFGDIDSGPIFLGYSIPANEFALGPSIVAKDYKTARKIQRLISIGASTIEQNDELRYKVRFVNMNISPMAEALVLNSLTMTKWTE